MEQAILMKFRTVLRVNTEIFIGIAHLEEKPRQKGTFIISGTNFLCLNTEGSIVGDFADSHRYAPITIVSNRILNGKFIRLSERKAKEYSKRYFLKTVPYETKELLMC